MQYLKVEWMHDFLDEPIFLYSELDKNRNELRKVEVFKNGNLNYASENFQIGTTFLSEVPIPKNEDISADSQFKVNVISKNDFDEIWNMAILGNQYF